MGQIKGGLIRKVTSLKRFNLYEIFCDRTKKYDILRLFTEVTARTGLTVFILSTGTETLSYGFPFETNTLSIYYTTKICGFDEIYFHKCTMTLPLAFVI